MLKLDLDKGPLYKTHADCIILQALSLLMLYFIGEHFQKWQMLLKF